MRGPAHVYSGEDGTNSRKTQIKERHACRLGVVAFDCFITLMFTSTKMLYRYIYRASFWNIFGMVLGLFQKLSSGGALFFRPLHTQDTHGVRAPRPPGHVSALINPAPLWSKYALTPRTSYPLPPPPSLGHVVNKPPPTGQKSACPPRIISGTALSC